MLDQFLARFVRKTSQLQTTAPESLEQGLKMVKESKNGGLRVDYLPEREAKNV